MASPYNIQLSPKSTPGHTQVEKLYQASADKASQLLMLNHEKYHTLFNDVGLHNHIVHHLLSLWALGATPTEIEAAYDLNKRFQLPLDARSSNSSGKMADSAYFNEHLGQSKFYSEYLHFFQDEINQKGVERVLQEYVFKGDERADDILGRMYSGFEHPILHLGFALEFQQPCLVAEALASACIHDKWPLPILLAAESHLSSHPNTPKASLLSITQGLASDPKISTAVRPTDPPNRVTHGLLKRVSPAELVPYLAQWRVQPTEPDIRSRTAEMVHTCAYISGTAQHPGKEVSMDFFLMHSTNLSVFYPVFMGLEWLSLEAKARLLTWKGWMDLVIYAACGCPRLHHDRISNYSPTSSGPWDSVIRRATKYPDDGHTSKLIRAILNAERTSREFEGDPGFPLKRDEFLKIAHMTMDSVEVMLKPGYELPERIQKLYVEMLGQDREVAKIVARFVRWCGIEGAWDEFPDLKDGGKERDGGKARL